MQLNRFRSAAITCLCAAIAILVAPTAHAEEVGYLSDPSEPSLSDRVADITQGRSLTELSAKEFSELVSILPADGTVVEVVKPTAKKTLLSTQVAAASSGTSVCTTSSQSVYIRQSSGYGGVGTKPTTACTESFQSLTVSTQLAKKNTFGFWINQGSPFVKSVTGLLTYTNKDITLKCTNTKATTWKAVTEHKIVMHYGTAVTLYSSSGESKLNCGT